MTLANIHPPKTVPVEAYRELRNALADALEGMREMLPYVGGYFTEKWSLDDYVDDAVIALADADEQIERAVAL